MIKPEICRDGIFSGAVCDRSEQRDAEQRPLPESKTFDNETAVTSQQVEERPPTSFGGQRTPATFIQLAPGTTELGDSDGGPGANRTMTISVSGSMVSSTTMVLNGGDVTSVGGL